MDSYFNDLPPNHTIIIENILGPQSWFDLK